MELRPILSALMRSKTGPVLVALQVAVSLAILANALHIVQNRSALAARPSGVADESALFYLTVQNLKELDQAGELATQQRELATLRALPGVLSVASTSQMPMSRSGSTNSLAVQRTQRRETTSAAMYLSPESLVQTLGLKLVEGRDFRPAEVVNIDENSSVAFPSTVIITRALAEKAYPGQASVLGKELFYGTGEDANVTRIVGVVERLQSQGAEAAPTSDYATILPVHLTGHNSAIYVVRAAPGQRERLIKDAQAALRTAAPSPLLMRARTVLQDRSERYRAELALAWMLITVSALLLLITASGIVGMASLWVTQRRKQIGVRRALGARRIDILRYFLLENLVITSAGVALGVLLAIGLNTLLVRQLGMQKLPLAYLGGGALMFWSLGALAVYAPAWRGASTSPAVATRST